MQQALSLIACQVNALKSASVQLSGNQPSLPVLDKYYHPPCPVLGHGSSIIEYINASDPPPWSDQVPCPLSRTACLMHLGHAIPARLKVDSAVVVLLGELRLQLNELHQQPFQGLDRVLFLNYMVLLRLLYSTECLPLTEELTKSFAKSVKTFFVGVLGLLLVIAQKTLYSHVSHRLGLGYFSVLHPTHVLDVLHRNQHIQSLSAITRGATSLSLSFCQPCPDSIPPQNRRIPPLMQPEEPRVPHKLSKLDWSPRGGLEPLMGVGRGTIISPGFVGGGDQLTWRNTFHSEDGELGSGLGRVDPRFA